MKKLRVFYGISKFADYISVVFENKQGQGDDRNVLNQFVKPLYWRYQTDEEAREAKNSDPSSYVIRCKDGRYQTERIQTISCVRSRNIINDIEGELSSLLRYDYDADVK